MLIKNPDEPVCIVINKEVDPQRFEQVKKIGIAFLPAWPQGIDQYTFSRILINEIKTWQDKLKSYAAYARQPFFPGSREIKNSNVLFGKILERQDSYSVILFCLKHQSRMLQTAQTVAKLTKFYTRKLSFWQTFIDRMQAFDGIQTEISKNKQIFSKYQRLSEIFRSPCPFALTGEAEGLMPDVQAFYQQVEREKMDTLRISALEKTDKMIKKLISLFETFKSDQAYRNQCLYKLRKLHKKIEKSRCIEQIHTLFNDAKDLFVDVIEEI